MKASLILSVDVGSKDFKAIEKDVKACAARHGIDMMFAVPATDHVGYTCKDALHLEEKKIVPAKSTKKTVKAEVTAPVKAEAPAKPKRRVHNGANKTPKATIELIETLARTGLPYSRIARVAGVSITTVDKYAYIITGGMKNMACGSNKGRNSMSPEKVRQMRTLYKEFNGNAVKVGEVLGMAPNTVGKYCRDMTF